MACILQEHHISLKKKKKFWCHLFFKVFQVNIFILLNGFSEKILKTCKGDTCMCILQVLCFYPRVHIQFRKRVLTFNIYFHSVVLKFFFQFQGFGLCGETLKMMGGPMNLEESVQFLEKITLKGRNAHGKRIRKGFLSGGLTYLQGRP